MNSDESIHHFEFVLREADDRKVALQKQIADLQREARDLTITIGGILRLAPASVVARYSNANLVGQSVGASRVNSADIPGIPASQKYSMLSTRWAILLALSEMPQPVTVPELADTLKTGGFTTDAANFNNNVSSVIGRMKTAKGEVEVIEGRWFITEIGRSAINYIKAQKLRKRLSVKTESPDVGASGESAKGESNNGTALVS